VIFCVFDPTDEGLRDAIFAEANDGLMMYGLVNHIPKSAPSGSGSAAQASTALYDRNAKSKDVYSYGYFSKNAVPNGFVWEYTSLTGSRPPGVASVYIHHKFVVIDAETANPVLFTGSQNFSNNSVLHNDENLLEITGCPRLARIYLAEFMRLYDHFKTRILYEQSVAGSDTMAKAAAHGSREVKKVTTKSSDPHEEFTLVANGSWQDKWFKKDTPEFKTRRALTGEPPSEGLPAAGDVPEQPYNAAETQDPADGDVPFTPPPHHRSRSHDRS
jgi:phosphatidylserine/phosphatidylglycerophosphate/cardiolipin synthase-like enzyme